MPNNKLNTKPNRREDWGTPRDLFEKINSVLRFSLDAAASADNALCENYVTAEQDFLSMSRDEIEGKRSGGWIWCNPPYGKRGCGAWVKKLKHYTSVMVLLPASVGAKWFEDVWDYYDYVFIFNRRLIFEGAPAPAMFDSCLAINGDISAEELYGLYKLGGTIVTRWS